MKVLALSLALLAAATLLPAADAAPETCEEGGTVDVDTQCRKDPFVCTVHVSTDLTGSHCVLRRA